TAHQRGLGVARWVRAVAQALVELAPLPAHAGMVVRKATRFSWRLSCVLHVDRLIVCDCNCTAARNPDRFVRTVRADGPSGSVAIATLVLSVRANVARHRSGWSGPPRGGP